MQELLANRAALLDRLSRAYGQAQHAQATGRCRPVPGGPRKWEDKYVGPFEDEDGEGDWDDAGDD